MASGAALHITCTQGGALAHAAACTPEPTTQVYNDVLYDLLDINSSPSEVTLYEDAAGQLQVCVTHTGPAWREMAAPRLWQQCSACGSPAGRSLLQQCSASSLQIGTQQVVWWQGPAAGVQHDPLTSQLSVRISLFVAVWCDVQVAGARKVSVSSEAEALALFFEVGGWVDKAV